MGDVTLRAGEGGDAIVKAALLASDGEPFEAWLPLIRQFVDGVSSTAQEKLPVFAVDEAIAA